MNPFLLPPTERLAEWRRFRINLSSLDEQSQLQRVAQWVSQAPMINWVLDYDDKASWPGPWDLINAGDFDDVAKAYLMERTLVMAGWQASRLKLIYIRNIPASFQTMVLLVDDTWALNYQHAEVLNFDTERSNCTYLVCHSVNPQGSHAET